MKKYLLALITLIFLVGTSCHEEIDIEKENEAIKAAIEGFVDARSELDYDSYIDTWVDAPYSFLSWAHKDGYYFEYLEDWKKLGKEEFAKMLQAQKEGGYSINLKPFDLTIKVYEETAWAHFTNKWTKVYEENKESEDLGESFVICSLEKHNGEWKMVYISVFILYSYEGEPEKEED